MKSMANRKLFSVGFALLFALSIPLNAFAEKSKSKFATKSREEVLQQTHQVTGVVKDANNEPLLGATVTVKGTQLGVATGLDGEFTLNVPDKNAQLIVSYIGFTEQVIDLKGRGKLEIVLQEDTKLIDEVVVVGYGVAKKRDLVGSVEQIGGKDLAVKGNMNISRSLQGMVPGLNITMSDGKPTRNAGISLRGASSIGAGGSALILVDGVDAHGDLTTINPDDIESISVLKDASSSAIYGARGTFGVILITTKKASKGKPKVSYSGSISSHSRIFEPKLVNNGLEWTNAFLDSYAGAKGNSIPPAGINNVFPFSQDWYEELQRRDADPTLERVALGADGRYQYYGNTDWMDVVYKNSTWSTEHNVSVSGGNDRANYYVSGRFFNQDGIYKDTDEYYKQFNVRAKGEIKINDKITVANNMDMIRRNVHQPMVMYDKQNLWRQIEHQGYPMTMPKNLDGTWTEAGVYTGWAGFVEGTSFQENKKFDLKNTTTLTYTPTDELTLKGDLSYYYNHSERLRAEDQYKYHNGPDITGIRNTFSSVEHYTYNNEYLAANATANYIPKFTNKDHTLNLLAGWNIEQKKTTNTRAYRRGLIYSTKPSLELADGDIIEVGQSGADWAYVGLLFRANYNYKGKYLAEVSGRYDASSKFPKDSQWGLFPSGSLGWRISEENFMSGTKSWLDNLKLRASVGSLGNGTISPYQYLKLMALKRTSAIIDGNLQTQVGPPNNLPDKLTWETVTTYDIGLDADFFNNRLSLVFDYYRKNITDMFTIGPSLPGVFGAAIPKGNYADLKTRGWELSVQWRNQFDLGGKPLKYSVKAMVWDDRSWVTKYNNPTRKLSDHYEGKRIGEIWGYEVAGLFRSQQEIDDHADQSLLRVSDTNILLPGDLKFVDRDDSGRIDNGQNTVDNPGDLKKIGNTEARYNFGLNFNTSWNGIGLSMFFQGVGKRDWYPHRESAFFWGKYNRPYSFHLKDHTGNKVYTDENQNFDAYWPRMRGYLAQSAGRAMGKENDRYLQNAAYIRLKNIQVDYTFPKSICQTLHVENLRVYATGDNLWTWSPMFKHTRNFDPENITPGDSDFRSSAGKDGDGYGYPMLRTFTFGLNVTF